MTKACDDSSYIGPLTWIEARKRLRSVLEEYLNDRSLKAAIRIQSSPILSQGITPRWISYNLDLYVGVVSISIALLFTTIWSLVTIKFGAISPNWQPLASLFVYKSQTVASTLVVSGSLLSIWMAHRRRYLCLNDSDTSKRREIKKFLKAYSLVQLDTCNGVDVTDTPDLPNDAASLSGTSQTDIYPVYRKTLDSSGKVSARWSHIPSLLMVRGDYIALQIGDVVPASCVSLEERDAFGNFIQLNFGERLSISTFAKDPDSIGDSLPKGRTIIPTESKSFLTLCNQMQIFRVIDTPIEEFIRRPYAVTKSSLISRKFNDMRIFLSVLAAPVLIFGALAVFGRPRQSYSDLTITIPLLLLSVLGVLPVIGTAFVFLLEIMGTARILAAIHPYASLHNLNDGFRIQYMNKRARISLFCRYLLITGISRFALWDFFNFISGIFGRRSSERYNEKLLRIPPASLNVLEKLGVATAFVLIDDELVCESHSIPQQLLIPSGRGLKLLDLCPAYEDDGFSDQESENFTTRHRGKSFDSDSDSDEENERLQSSVLRRKVLRRRSIRRTTFDAATQDSFVQGPYEVQFEDPNWWQHLPSLKCIGLACLLNGNTTGADDKHSTESLSDQTSTEEITSSLIQHTCRQRSSNQLRSLAQCIGFSIQPNSSGAIDCIAPFQEQSRIHVLSNYLFRERVQLDAHERSTEQSRWWGSIRPDSTSVIVKDKRTLAHQMLTTGDPDVVISLCTEAWQGEISTILPLAGSDKQKILETSNSWKLADLDVTAFCYSPLPHSLESRLSEDSQQHIYLLDNASPGNLLMKDRTLPKEWSLIRNQIFLGMLGSLVVPRREIQKVLDNLNEAGVRFVYFSPRNMRRQKELASQLGIDVAWNCAISLRPLLEGEEDPHRMVSPYGDWDKNAKLPHGVEEVRKHLQEVDNVPLLVSVFTDTTKSRTREMVEVFQDYSDTVISIGLSHLPRNYEIFESSDIAIGIDVWKDDDNDLIKRSTGSYFSEANPSELEFASAVAANMCAFRFRGASSVSNISKIMEISRTSLEAAIAASMFIVTGCISLSLYIILSLCMPPSIMTYCPLLGATLYLQLVLPGTALALAMSDNDSNCMKRVPPKNETNSVFGGKEGYTQYSRIVLKALLPAVFPQVLHPIVYGSLMLGYESYLVNTTCPGATSWIDVVGCNGLLSYHGNVRSTSGTIVFVVFIVCIIVSSASYVRRFNSIAVQKPWNYNYVWVCASIASIILTSIYAFLDAPGVMQLLPWYYYLLCIVFPFLCLLWVEYLKIAEKKADDRSETLRRLQFETRLGAHSPR